MDPFPKMGQPCGIKADQANSYLRAIKTLPMHVGIDASFSKHDRDVIVHAVEEWNLFSNASLGFKLFEIGPDVSFNLPKSKEYCAPAVQRFAGLWITHVDSDREWERLGEGAEAGAFTRRCGVGDGVRQAEQIIVMNYAEYKHTSALLAESLHELGHVLGLDHSCAKMRRMSSSAYVFCDSLSDYHPYRRAVMFPELRIANGEAEADKVSLRSNDMERAYCQYKDRSFKPAY